MPYLESTTDWLPAIDKQPSPEALQLASTEIEAGMDPEAQSVLHPSIPQRREPRFSDLMEREHARIAAGGAKAEGIDISRYEALDAPERGNLEEWKATVQKAYASTEYLRSREINLSLLETYGKNSWLVGNSQLEDILRSLEKDVEAAKEEQRAVEQGRKDAQDYVAGEMQSLEETWRRGVGRSIEAQAAAEGLRQQILERRRQTAS